MKTTNQMIAEIQKRVCIRQIWHCRAGWGMRFVLQPEFHIGHMRLLYRDLGLKVGNYEVTYCYYKTLQACVEGEYKYWVLQKNQRLHPRWEDIS